MELSQRAPAIFGWAAITLGICLNSSVYNVFTGATLATARSSCRRVSALPSVTSRCSTETTKRRITYTTPHDSPWILVFFCRRSRQNSNRVTTNGAANAGGVG